MGQRQTYSGSVTFEQVLVTPDEILTSIYPSDSPIASLLNVFKQINQVNIYLGIVQGAFTTGRCIIEGGIQRFFNGMSTMQLHARS
jgi:hypothetical protein